MIAPTKERHPFYPSVIRHEIYAIFFTVLNFPPYFPRKIFKQQPSFRINLYFHSSIIKNRISR